MRSRFSLILAVLCLAAGGLSASTPYSGPRPWDSEDGSGGGGPFPNEITRTMNCEIRRILEPGVVELYDPESKRLHQIRLSDRIELTAQRKKDFGGRKKLEFGDLKSQQSVKVTFRPSDGQILRIKVVQDKKPS
jgi:hypothetical protein